MIQEAIETGGFGVRTFSKFKINIFMQTSICKRVVVKGLTGEDEQFFLCFDTIDLSVILGLQRKASCQFFSGAAREHQLREVQKNTFQFPLLNQTPAFF